MKGQNTSQKASGRRAFPAVTASAKTWGGSVLHGPNQQGWCVWSREGRGRMGREVREGRRDASEPEETLAFTLSVMSG